MSRGRSAPSGPGWGSAVAVLAVACCVHWSWVILRPSVESRTCQPVGSVCPTERWSEGWKDAGPHRAAAGPPAPVSHSANSASGAQVEAVEGSGFRGLLHKLCKPLNPGNWRQRLVGRREGGGGTCLPCVAPLSTVAVTGPVSLLCSAGAVACFVLPRCLHGLLARCCGEALLCVVCCSGKHAERLSVVVVSPQGD